MELLQDKPSSEPAHEVVLNLTDISNYFDNPDFYKNFSLLLSELKAEGFRGLDFTDEQIKRAVAKCKVVTSKLKE